MYGSIIALLRRLLGRQGLGGPGANADYGLLEQESYSIVFIILRRMRTPLMVLLGTYAVAVIGMTLMPGQHPETGEPWQMSLFDAFYFISYVSTTIGFGEIPHPFSGAQRLWATFCMYLTVISWIYAIGALLALAQDKALRLAVTQLNFSRTVRGLREPFYLVCGYGGTARALVNTLEERFIRTVVLEREEQALNDLMIANHPVYIPSMSADIAKPRNLIRAGLKSRYCAGVIALTNDNHANLQVALTSKLLNPKVPVICRVNENEAALNMASFGTEHILNPFSVFAASLHTTLRSPYLHMLREWFMERRPNLLGDTLEAPQKGLWIICGYGRFGKAAYERLKHEEGIRIVIVESNFNLTGYPKAEQGIALPEFVTGRGTEANTLIDAGIAEAVGLLAGTDDDVNNLSIVMTARDITQRRIRPLFVVLRQNRPWNQAIFEAAKADVLMQASQLIADYIRVLISTPLLFNFMRQAKKEGNHWAAQLVQRMRKTPYYQTLVKTTPTIWELSLNAQQAPQIHAALQRGWVIRLQHLLCHPRDWRERLPCLPLLLVRGEREVMLPTEDFSLMEDDRLLFCCTDNSIWWMEWILRDFTVLSYMVNGEEPPRSYVWQRYRQYQERRGKGRR